MRKTRVESFLDRLHRLQSDIYTYAGKLEDKATNAKSDTDKLKYQRLYQHATNAGFELDEAQTQMNLVNKIINNDNT